MKTCSGEGIGTSGRKKGKVVAASWNKGRRWPVEKEREKEIGKEDKPVLPNDDWFVDIAQENISKISGKARMGNGARDLNSPTASVSTMSNGSS
ncbi:hypothetical protein IEQ34_021921 [Dendrobium chrysotoxum]|uniref:Uncharacterized protein n=1 Tax=Dendrobium chrysotoxum TaxID=161865 RepID=A0AAV7FVR7_DENCH|nr:hypothetical protein IEQ34_021921 [Dendrobium chrysotoxum]